MARPKAVKTDEAAAVESPADLRRKLDSMQRAILELAAQNEALKVAARSEGINSVMLENTGMVQIVVPLDNGKSVVFDNTGPRRVGSVPAHIAAWLERETDFFSKGMLRRVGEVSNNPNIIEDPEKWVDALAEKDIKKAIKRLTSEGALNLLWSYIESLEETTGKHLMLKRAIAARASELFGYELIEDETED